MYFLKRIHASQNVVLSLASRVEESDAALAKGKGRSDVGMMQELFPNYFVYGMNAINHQTGVCRERVFGLKHLLQILRSLLTEVVKMNRRWMRHIPGSFNILMRSG